MRVQIRRVWPSYDRTVDPPRFKHATVIARDEQGIEHMCITFSDWLASLCLQYERKSSTSEPQPPAVELVVNDKGKILDLQVVAA